MKTLEFLVRTLRKTTIPITIALKKKTMTTPSPVARAGWLDKDDKNVLLSGQKSPEQSCSWKSLPEHKAPPLAGGGFVQVRSWRWKQDSKQWLQAPHVDHPRNFLLDSLYSNRETDTQKFVELLIYCKRIYKNTSINSTIRAIFLFDIWPIAFLTKFGRFGRVTLSKAPLLGSCTGIFRTLAPLGPLTPASISSDSNNCGVGFSTSNQVLCSTTVFA